MASVASVGLRTTFMTVATQIIVGCFRSRAFESVDVISGRYVSRTR